MLLLRVVRSANGNAGAGSKVVGFRATVLWFDVVKVRVTSYFLEVLLAAIFKRGGGGSIWNMLDYYRSRFRENDDLPLW